VKAGWGLLAVAGALAAGALWAPLARAGTYDVVSCSIDGATYANNAWRIQNNLAGDARYVTKTTCGPNDPLDTHLVPGAFDPHPPRRPLPTRYRFNSASGRFSFRLRLRPNDSYPYARGTSKTVRVSVG